MKKQIWVIALVLILLIAVAAPTASADPGEKSGTCGANLTWVLDSSGVLTISGSGAMTNYDYGGAPWNGFSDRITAVVIGTGVTSVGSSAFWECANLAKVSIPDGVKSIGGWAFFGCSSLTSVEIPGSVTSLGNSTFAFCSALASVKINSKLSVHHNSFHECTSLTTLKVGSGVTGFDELLFPNLYALTSVTVDAGNSHYSAKGNVLLSKDGKTLIYCPIGRKGSLVVPDGVTVIGADAFYDCNKLTSVTLPDSVKTIDTEAFLHCTGLTSVNIPDGVTDIEDYAFFGCKKLTKIEIPGSVKNIGMSAFCRCSKLSSVEFGDGVSNIGADAFRECTKLKSVEIPLSVSALGSCAFYESKLADVYYEGTKAQWDQLLESGVSQLPDGVKVHCKEPQVPAISLPPRKQTGAAASGTAQNDPQGMTPTNKPPLNVGRVQIVFSDD